MTSINPSSAPVRFLFEDTQETPARFFEDFKKHCNWKPRDNKRFENPEAYLKAANYVMENKLKSEVEIFFIYLKS